MAEVHYYLKFFFKHLISEILSFVLNYSLIRYLRIFYSLNLIAKLKNLGAENERDIDVIIFRNMKGFRKGYIPGNVFGVKSNEDNKGCCEQCLLY